MTHDTLQHALAWRPVVQNKKSEPAGPVVVGGMGGSALPGNAVRFLDAAADVSVHRDYGLPENASLGALYVAISYSGNTEETLSFAEAALKEGHRLAVVTSGGALLSFAEKNALPFVQVPDGLQPRDALLYLLPALLALIGRDDLCVDIAAVSIAPQPVLSESGTLATALAGGLPLFYSSRKNGFLAYVSKIHLNETAKMPSFANVFPELNHNEMQSFDTHAPEAVAAPARFVVLHDARDDARVIRRMQLFSALVEERGRIVLPVHLAEGSRATQLVRHWYVMHLAARELARVRGVDPADIALIEDFKRRLAA